MSYVKEYVQVHLTVDEEGLVVPTSIALDVSTDYLLLGKETDKDKLRESLSSLMEQMSRFAQNL